MLHMISARCVAHDLHTIAPWPLERTCWRQFTVQWGDCKKSQTPPLNVIITIIMLWLQKLRELAIRGRDELPSAFIPILCPAAAYTTHPDVLRASVPSIHPVLLPQQDPQLHRQRWHQLPATGGTLPAGQHPTVRLHPQPVPRLQLRQL